MDVRHTHLLQKTMKIRTKRLLIATMVATSASTLCSYTHFRNHSFFSKNGSNEKNWFSSLVAKRFKSIKAPTLPEATVNTLLRANEHATTNIPKSHGPVSRFETNHYRANPELEDRHCECRINNDKGYLFGVFDGHSGRHCSESLRTRLPLYISLGLMNKVMRDKFVAGEISEGEVVEYLGLRSDDEIDNEPVPCLAEKQKRFKTGTDYLVEHLNEHLEVGSENVEEALQRSYLTLDKDIVTEAIPDGECNEPVWSGLSGAVAITAYIKDDDLYVGNAGNYNSY